MEFLTPFQEPTHRRVANTERLYYYYYYYYYYYCIIYVTILEPRVRNRIRK